jgi:hypothetical protein
MPPNSPVWNLKAGKCQAALGINGEMTGLRRWFRYSTDTGNIDSWIFPLVLPFRKAPCVMTSASSI